MNSPLGKYGPIVVAILSVGIVGSWIASEFLYGVGIMVIQPSGLKELAFLAGGTLFGQVVAVNGWKQPLQSAHQRIDAIEVATGIPTHNENPPS